MVFLLNRELPPPSRLPPSSLPHTINPQSSSQLGVHIQTWFMGNELMVFFLLFWTVKATEDGATWVKFWVVIRREEGGRRREEQGGGRRG
jgi:hypothetical protein